MEIETGADRGIGVASYPSTTAAGGGRAAGSSLATRPSRCGASQLGGWGGGDQRRDRADQLGHAGRGGQLPDRRRRRSSTPPTIAPRPSRTKPAFVSMPLVAVAVVPSPVTGAGVGTWFTVSVAEAVTPLEQTMSGL